MNCPSREQLLLILTQDRVEQDDAIIQHAQNCALCQSRLAQLRSTLSLAGAWASFTSSDSLGSEVSNEIRQNLDRLYWEQFVRKHRRQFVAVMVCHWICGETAAEAPSHQLSRTGPGGMHQMALATIDRWKGTPFGKAAVGAVWAFFSSAEQALSCAFEIQHNLLSQETQFRIGLHSGAGVVVEHRGEVDLVGDLPNLAAMVESAAYEINAILASSEFKRGLPIGMARTGEEFAVLRGLSASVIEPFPSISLSLPLLKESKKAEFSTVRSAASSSEDSLFACPCVVEHETTAECWVVPLQTVVRRFPGIEYQGPAGREESPWISQAATEAFTLLRGMGFPATELANEGIVWKCATVPFQPQATAGLALALAIISAYTESSLPTDLLVAGGLEADTTTAPLLVKHWSALKQSMPAFKRIAMLRDVARQLPAELLLDTQLQIWPLDSLEEGALELFGPALQLPAHWMTLWPNIDAEADQLTLTVIDAQDKFSRLESETGSWKIGDSLRLACRSSRCGHVAIVNIGANGKPTILRPNALDSITVLMDGEVVQFPSKESNAIQLHGPPGRERFIAIASSKPIPWTPSDFGIEGSGVFAQPSLKQLRSALDTLTFDVFAFARAELYVSGRMALPLESPGYQKGAQCISVSPP